MKIFDTSTLNENSIRSLNSDEASWVYNGLDCCVTAEVYNELMEQLETEPPEVRRTYEYALDKLAPIMEMSLRGTKIDEGARQSTIRDLERVLEQVDRKFQRIMEAVIGARLNWRSPLQLKNLFYGMMGLKEIKARNAQGRYAPTVNRDALEHFQTYYIYARPLASMILLMRDLHKQLGFLKTEIDEDGRIRTNYNLTGTNTGRLASSMNDFGTGTNLQNVNRKLRYPFVADQQMYMLNVDLEQADGRNVGAICWNLFIDMTREEIYELAKGDPRLAEHCKDNEWIGPVGEELAGAYLDACESGDLHTTVCRMVWPEALVDFEGNSFEWPEDESEWKKFCDSVIAHGQDSFRQLSKKGGHGTNYYGTPRTMGKHLHTPTKIIEGFQNKYFYRFPAIPLWHNYVIRQIEQVGTVTTLFGRRRMFFGRSNDASTHRKAIAYEPQSCTGEQIDRGLHQVWKAHRDVQLLNQVHDSILFQLPFDDIERQVPEVLETMKVEITLKKDRKFVIPLDAAGGWNWGYQSEENPYGLSKWQGSEKRIPPVYRKKRNSLKDHLK